MPFLGDHRTAGQARDGQRQNNDERAHVFVLLGPCPASPWLRRPARWLFYRLAIVRHSNEPFNSRIQGRTGFVPVAGVSTKFLRSAADLDTLSPPVSSWVSRHTIPRQVRSLR